MRQFIHSQSECTRVKLSERPFISTIKIPESVSTFLPNISTRKPQYRNIRAVDKGCLCRNAHHTIIYIIANKEEQEQEGENEKKKKKGEEEEGESREAEERLVRQNYDNKAALARSQMRNNQN